MSFWGLCNPSSSRATRCRVDPLVFGPQVDRADRSKVNVPYTAYGTSKLSGQVVAVPGGWTGVSAGQIVHVVSGGPR